MCCLFNVRFYVNLFSESSKVNSNKTFFTSPPSNGLNYPPSNWPSSVPMYPNPRFYNQYNYPNDYYSSYNEFYPSYPNMMMNPRLTPRPRGINMMPPAPVWM